MTKLCRPFFAALLACLALVSPLRAQEKAGQVSFATGFVVSTDGHVVTTYHSIKNREQLLVGPIGTNRFLVAQVVRTDERKDLALLKTRLTTAPLRIAQWSGVPVGLEIYAIGFPQPRFQGITRKITQGLINGDRTTSGENGYFQFSAEIQKGNSGGPVLGPDASVVGVVRAKLDALTVAERTKDLTQNVNYAIKSSTLLAFLRESGLSVPAHTLDLRTHLRPYEIYRRASGAVVLIIGRNKATPAPRGIEIAPQP